ncbi:MAG: glucans biosynthesis glucosyltransferase MdoH, partial [Gemmatimonadetes bacterium]|nr:glucans biosynthesis glucosyltransferase MdoH [Gemmatimonadota bacterium]
PGPATTRIPAQRLRRATFIGLVLATAAYGTLTMLRIVAAGGFSPLEAVILALFAPTFAWIAVPFWTAVAGFGLRLLRRDPLGLGPLVGSGSEGGTGAESSGPEPAYTPRGRTAVVMPIYNEDPEAVTRRLGAVAASLVETGRAAAFDIHLLSDTADPDRAQAEEAAWARLQGRHPEIAFHYRRREDRAGRKAGNIGEFCSRCRDRYDFMVVLDADSIMSGETLLALVRRIESDASLGLVQTLPLPTGQSTLFGRIVQFASRLYGPLLATGAAFWQGDTGNYWGHNAIVRLDAFERHARLPTLSGTAPWGGEILSHDFVEAAWLRRAGWRVILDPTLRGSWEEVPATVPAFARRDRRWAQGSLQHLRLLARPGLALFSRLHLLLGAMGYLASALWLLLLIAGTAWVLIPAAGGGGVDLPLTAPGERLSLLAVTALLLFLPKALGVVLAMREGSRAFGGAARLSVGVLLETTFSVLLAPVMMIAHARFVAAIAVGRPVGWDPGAGRTDHARRRAETELVLPAVVTGLAWGAMTLLVSPAFFVWMTPIFVGLIVSPALVRVSARVDWGEALRRRGILLTPAERVAPAELRHRRLTDPTPSTGVPSTMLHAERALFDLERRRPVLVLEDGGKAASATLVAPVEGLGEAALRMWRSWTGTDPRLVITDHRARAMGLNAPPSSALSLRVEAGAGLSRILELAAERTVTLPSSNGTPGVRPAFEGERAGLLLAHLGRLLPAVLAFPVPEPRPRGLDEALAGGRVLTVAADEAVRLAETTHGVIHRVSDAPVPLPEAEDSRFILYRESHGRGEHVAVLVGSPDSWPDPVPLRLHSACLTGDLFGSLRCDCGEQLRGSLDVFRERGGGVLLYLAQEGRGIGLGNKFRAYSLQETGLDTIDADSTLGFGADERRYELAARMLRDLEIDRVELLTNNPEKVKALEESGITVAGRSALHGRLNRHNLPYVRAKVHRAGHWLRDMLAQPLQGD